MGVGLSENCQKGLEARIGLVQVTEEGESLLAISKQVHPFFDSSLEILQMRITTVHEKMGTFSNNS